MKLCVVIEHKFLTQWTLLPDMDKKTGPSCGVKQTVSRRWLENTTFNGYHFHNLSLNLVHVSVYFLGANNSQRASTCIPRLADGYVISNIVLL